MKAKKAFPQSPGDTARRDLSEEARRRFQPEYGLDNRAPVHSIQQLEDATLRPPAQKNAHWSTAWSDLMMTMFILFLSLFVYQAAHKDLLINDDHEVVAGDTREAVETVGDDKTSSPFATTSPAAPLITSGTVNKVEPITLQEIDLDEAFSDADMDKTIAELARVIPKAATRKSKKQTAHPGPAASPPAEISSNQPDSALAQKKPVNREEQIVSSTAPPEVEHKTARSPISPESEQAPAGTLLAQAEADDTSRSPGREAATDSAAASTQPPKAVIQPQPLELEGEEEAGSVKEIFSESRRTLDVHNLGKFASIDLVRDKAVRIVLTGDLLFETGHAALSRQAIDSLEKIAEAIRQTSHTVHIEGHTDDVPIFAGRYANNWELSIARANAVANFLIEDMGMEPQQFVISGFSSYKPVAPNTSAKNRAVNRRVEIVIAEPQKRQEIASRETTNRAFQTL